MSNVVDSAGSPLFSATVVHVFADDTWYLITVTYDCDASTGKAGVLYINDTEVASGYNPSMSPVASGRYPATGAAHEIANGDGSPEFACLMDYRIYDVVLTPDQMVLLYADTSAP